MRSALGESGQTGHEAVDGLLGQEDWVTGGLGELLDAGSDVDRVTDEGDSSFAGGKPDRLPICVSEVAYNGVGTCGA
jgi:hypothetical protein